MNRGARYQFSDIVNRVEGVLYTREEHGASPVHIVTAARSFAYRWNLQMAFEMKSADSVLLWIRTRVQPVTPVTTEVIPCPSTIRMN